MLKSVSNSVTSSRCVLGGPISLQVALNVMAEEENLSFFARNPVFHLRNHLFAGVSEIKCELI